MSAANPAATISLVTWNGLHWLPGCLDSVAAQTLADYELLILDNGSTDGSVDWLRQRAADDEHISLVESDVNLGFARGHNRNIERARGGAVLLLNQDVELDPGFLAATVAALEQRPEVGSVQARLRRLAAPGERSELLDTTGLEMHRDRRVVSRGQLSVDRGAAPMGPVWGVDGAAPVYRLAALASARLPRSDGSGTTEVLDEDFFSYKEDVDLAWRLRRLGWEAWYEPTALAWHARGGGDTGVSGWRKVARANMSNPPKVRALSWRNQRLMQLKNEEAGSFLRDLPWIARREAMAWAFMIFADPRRMSAVPALLRGLPAARRKRRAITAATTAASASGTGHEGHSRLGRWASRARVTNLGRTIGYVRRRGIRRAYQRVLDELREVLWVARHRTGDLEGARQLNPRAISARLDRPRFDGLEGSPHLGLLGWAYAKAGIEAVDVYLDGRLVKAAVLGRARPDVTSAWRHLDEAEIEGFSAVLSLVESATGDRLLSVVIRDGAGNIRILSRRFQRLDAAASYPRFRRRVLATGDPPLGASPDVRLLVAARDGYDLTATLRSIAAQDLATGHCTVIAGLGGSDEASAAAASALGSGAGWTWTVAAQPGSVLPDAPSDDRMVGLLLAGEVLEPTAVRRLARALESASAGLAYADHDALGEDGQHGDPWFVPDWSPHRILAQDYIGGGFLVRDSQALRSALDSDPGAVGSPAWRYALLLRLTEAVEAVVHVPLPLWSCPSRTRRDPDAEAEVVETELERRGILGAEVETQAGSTGPLRRIHWPAPSAPPLVSIIVPTTGRRDLVVDLLDLLEQGTSYQPTELVVLDNSRGRNPDGIALLENAGATVVERDEAFNWARLSNAGAARAAGDLLLFLNDDVRAADEAMAGCTRAGPEPGGCRCRRPAPALPGGHDPARRHLPGRPWRRCCPPRTGARSRRRPVPRPPACEPRGQCRDRCLPARSPGGLRARRRFRRALPGQRE